MNKFTKEEWKIANKIEEKLAKTTFGPNEAKYCFALRRKTLGFQQFEDYISRSQFKSITLLEVNTISNIRNRLKKRNIIHKSSTAEGFNINITQWDINPIVKTGFTVKRSLPNSKGQADKSGKDGLYLQGTTKNLNNKGGEVLKKLRIEAINRLEGKRWLRQMMWQMNSFKEGFIDRIFREYSFMQCYNAYLAFEEATDVRNKEAWLLAKLERGQEEE